MGDKFGFDHGTRFPRMQNPRGQFSQPNDNQYRSSDFSNTTRPINQNVQNSKNPRLGPETECNMNTELSQFVHRPCGVQAPRSRMTNSVRHSSDYGRTPNFETFRPRFPCDSRVPIPPEPRGCRPGWQSQTPSSCQFTSHFDPPSDSPRLYQNKLEPYHEPPPDNYSIKHLSRHLPLGQPPIHQQPVSLQPQFSQQPLPPYICQHPLPPHIHQHPPPVPQAGANTVCPPQTVQNSACPKEVYFQNNEVSVQPNWNGLFHQNDQETFLNDQSGNCQKNTDTKWIASWLKGKLDKTPTGSKHFKIHDAQDLIQSSMVLLATLQKQKKHLQTIADSADPETWQQEMMVAEATKMQLCDKQKKLTDDAVDNLEMKIIARTKKREWLKRKRKADYEDKLVEEKNRELKHQTLDKWRRQITQKDLEHKQNKEIKASADVFLSEVRKKLSDVKKSTDLLHALQKLRKIRKDFAEKQGRYSSLVYDKDFENTVDNVTKLLKKQQDLYLEEEKTLKVMLETDWVEALEKEKEDKKYSDMVKKKREEKKLRLMLFGKQVTPSHSDDLYAFYQYYTQAKQNFDALIQIRQGWDMYLVPDSFPDSSRIPDGWVLPSEPFSDVWATAIKD